MKRPIILAAMAGLVLSRMAFAQAPSATPILTPIPTLSPQLAPATSPKVTLTTTMGAIEITLDPVGAPKTSAHMLRLFQTTHYVGAAVYRIEPGFLIQLGDLDVNWTHRWPPAPIVPNTTVELETANNKHGRGTVSLARGDDPNSGQSTFYFDLGDNTSLNATADAPPNTTGYATFGRVTAGMDVLDAIAAAPRAPTGGPFPGKAPLVPITITSIATDPPAPIAATVPPRVTQVPKPKPKVRPKRPR
jgi:cyclophilin family peptidyl-prolyl cis-trans isomerase